MIFAVLGSGKQGTAAAYDLARFAQPSLIKMGDVDLECATASCLRVNNLVGSEVCQPFQVDALDPQSLIKFLPGNSTLISCVGYWMHSKIASVAIESKTNMVDLGGNTDVTIETIAMNHKALDAGVTIVPDVGLAPGLVNSLANYIIETSAVDSIKLYCGVLPQNPVPPLNYKLTFNVEGLVGEYDYQAVVLRDGRIELIDTLTELEDIKIKGFGKLEAFATSGGTSMAPYSYIGHLKNYEYKTLRYPGHCALMKMFKDCGFWKREEIDIEGQKVVPLDVFCSVFGDALKKFKDKDVSIVRAIGTGKKKVQIDIIDYECEQTGFTSMERLTGFSASINAIEITQGRVEKGCIPYEKAVKGTVFVDRLKERGIQISV